ncbi:hypothetical protein AUEXF2481DRAFT_601559 [Aureobasidium subglaciale EXF-2481]|uniref:Uncharacterized protein n=1 Tax=Aureobasidium subglaciale (strain EXF-2481) TaxID=1043005 RepID=A0A074YID4_AURSE|nr:uncharacterized protein AUEXF2481DRAFT_601559 [Aureobasidium subglaciale EXF-2481]KEQ97470.1 hypothetical protein AUEXF2481DRAFT_601559 [Aureobasidium subglaciale EXF-2481]
MAPSQTGSHAFSRTPSAYVPCDERLDLTMPKHVIRQGQKFTCAHLNYLECHGRTVFADDRCVNWFLNALRLRWKVSGRVLRDRSDQSKDLCEFLDLEVENKRIISDLFTDEAIYYLLDRSAPDGMMIFTAVVHEIYNFQWQNWSEEQNNKHKQQGHHALVIFHAQATANQLSNNVLAFKNTAAPELRKWAEMTVSGHLMAVVTQGHLPQRPAVRNTARFAFEDDATTRNVMDVKQMTNSPPPFSFTPGYRPPQPAARDFDSFAPIKDVLNCDLMDVRRMDTSSPPSTYPNDDYVRGQGPSSGRYQAPAPDGPSFLGEKRKILRFCPLLLRTAIRQESQDQVREHYSLQTLRDL